MDILVVEQDHTLCREVSHMLTVLCPQVTSVREAGSVLDALVAVSNSEPDLVLLSVELPDGSGFDFLKKLPKVSFQILFFSSFRKISSLLLNSVHLNASSNPLIR